MIVKAWSGVSVDIPWWNLPLWFLWARGRISYSYHMARLERAVRQWHAISPHGQVSLGFVDYGEALARASKLGTVSYTDMEHGFIFYNTDLGGPAPAGGR